MLLRSRYNNYPLLICSIWKVKLLLVSLRQFCFQLLMKGGFSPAHCPWMRLRVMSCPFSVCNWVCCGVWVLTQCCSEERAFPSSHLPKLLITCFSWRKNRSKWDSGLVSEHSSCWAPCTLWLWFSGRPFSPFCNFKKCRKEWREI